jgi:hypothetical protein
MGVLEGGSGAMHAGVGVYSFVAVACACVLSHWYARWSRGELSGWFSLCLVLLPTLQGWWTE